MPERWHGYHLLAVDETSLKTAPYPIDGESYLPGTPAQHGWNQFHLNVLFDLKNKLYIDAQVQKERRKNEGVALRAIVDRSPLSGPVLLLADRNYESYKQHGPPGGKGLEIPRTLTGLNIFEGVKCLTQIATSVQGIPKSEKDI